MVSRKNRLIERVKQTLRTPKPPRFLDTKDTRKGYRVVAVSLYTPEAEWIDQATKALQTSGSPKANRSLVVREAILRLQEDLGDTNAADMVKSFTERQAQRARQM